MKKTFTAPCLRNHGALQEVTQALGTSSAQDTVFVGTRGFQLPGVTGSSDGIVVPKP
jgi:hypothetical protein